MSNRWSKFWTPDRIEALTEHYGSGGGLSALARSWGITRGAVIGKWTRLLNETAAAAEFEAELLDAICEALEVETPFAVIAEKLGISIGGAMAAFAVLRRQMGAQAR